MTSAMRVVVIGARRRRQGLGAFVAQAFAAAGAEIVGIVGSTQRTADFAQAELANSSGIKCQSFADVRHALRSTHPDVVAVCSPYTLHRAHVEECARAGCHCLCEKPFWWDSAAPDRDLTSQLVEEFAGADLYLCLLTQWPQTLSAFHELYPGERSKSVRTFEMHMGPISTGREMVLDAAPHTVSMLQALLGYGNVVDARTKYLHEDGRGLCLHFVYQHDLGSTIVDLRLTTTESPPRPASYAINGKRVDRRIVLPRYEIHFEAESRIIRVEDPLQSLVKEFIAAVNHGRRTDVRALSESMTALEHLLEAVRPSP